MLGNTVDGDALRRTQSSMWQQQQQQPISQQTVEGGQHNPTSSSSSDTGVVQEGKWGERGQEDVTAQEAMQEFESLRHNLMSLHKTRTTETNASKANASRRASNAARVPSAKYRQNVDDDESKTDVEAGPEESEGFELGQFMREGHFEKRSEEDGSLKRVGVVYENMTVKGVGSTTSFVRTVPDAILGTFGPDRTLINDFTGCVRDGEMMLVLGRPGAGCSTFLKAISNNRESYAAVQGEVSYSGISAADQKKYYRGEVNYNGEDDIHFASLSVWKTLAFALMNKTKVKEKTDIPVIVEALMKMFGISHTRGSRCFWW
jgi:ATP-binding cassette subfamily G (WHITE) protein 2 (SNQ2)